MSGGRASGIPKGFGGTAIVGSVSNVPFSALHSLSACARAGRHMVCQIGTVVIAEPQPGVLQAVIWKYWQTNRCVPDGHIESPVGAVGVVDAGVADSVTGGNGGGVTFGGGRLIGGSGAPSVGGSGPTFGGIGTDVVVVVGPVLPLFVVGGTNGGGDGSGCAFGGGGGGGLNDGGCCSGLVG
jgi:hypothetical protein